MTNDSNFQRAQFKSQMVILRHLASVAEPEQASYMYDQLTETCRFLARRRNAQEQPTDVTFKNCVAENNSYAIES
jgi:hypothetical protein